MKYQSTSLPAEPCHHIIAAALLYDSSPALMQFMFRAPATATTVLGRLYCMEFGHFSHKFARVATIDGKVVGISLGYGAGELAKESFRGSAGLLFNSPPVLWWHLIRRVSSVVADYVKPPASGSFYLNNLAVEANYRGHGIGRDLLRETCSRARESGYQQVELDVASDNAGAVRLYEACMFKQISRSGTREYSQKYSLPPLLRMRMDLGAGQP